MWPFNRRRSIFDLAPAKPDKLASLEGFVQQFGVAAALRSRKLNKQHVDRAVAQFIATHALLREKLL